MLVYNRDFSYTLHSTPPAWGVRQNIAMGYVWYIGLQKMRIYQMVKKFNDRPMFSRFDTGV